MKRPAIAIAAWLLLLGACAGGSSDGSSIRVFAAASLTGVFPRIDDSASFQFGGSDELALQIREGAEADVYAAASPRYPQELADERLVNEPVVFATNELVLIVPADNPADIKGVEDLDAQGVKLVIGAAGVPVGDYTRTALENLGASGVLEHVVSEEQDVKAVVSKVLLGEADAGFVYATDVTTAGDDVTAISLPPDAQPTVEYMIAVVSASERREQAQSFIDMVLGDEGRRLLSETGFGLP